jgi:hypothetical protein
MAEKEKKILYGGSYDDAINETYQQIQNRPAFNYDVNGDALYQQYKDRYTQNARNAMKDTMGQTAALTGGYGSSYAQGVGQQRYDETMRGLTDMMPQLEQQAYQRYQDQGNALNDRLGMLQNLGAAEQATKQGNYQNIANMIASTGYQPSEQELAAAGMSPEQANAMIQMWITSNPDAAYYAGRLTPEDYYKLTGRYPIGYQAPGTGGSWKAEAEPKEFTVQDNRRANQQMAREGRRASTSDNTLIGQIYQDRSHMEQQLRAAGASPAEAQAIIREKYGW